MVKPTRFRDERPIDGRLLAMRLSPLDPRLYSMQTATALAHFVAGRYDEWVLWADKASREDPNFLPAISIIATSAGNSGQQERAQG
jgi:hypothetical protein